MIHSKVKSTTKVFLKAEWPNRLLKYERDNLHNLKPHFPIVQKI